VESNIGDRTVNDFQLLK